MKKYIKTAVIFTVILMLLCGCSAKRAKNAGYLVYRSSPIGVQIEYPDFWEMAEDKKNGTVAFVTPSEGYSDEYRDNVTVCTYKLDKKDEMAYDNYVTSYISALPSTIDGYNLVTEGDFPVGEHRGYRIVYEGNTNDGTLRLQQTFIESGKYVYIYSFIAEPKNYDYFNRNSEVMLQTLVPLYK